MTMFTMNKYLKPHLRSAKDMQGYTWNEDDYYVESDDEETKKKKALAKKEAKKRKLAKAENGSSNRGTCATSCTVMVMVSCTDTDKFCCAFRVL